MFLGHRVDLKAKARGEKSMPEKREPPEGADGAVSQDPRDRAKARLPESQSPAVQPHTRCDSALAQRGQGPPVPRFAGRHLRLARRWPAKPLKGMSGAPTSRSTRSAPTEHGMAYRARALRSRSPRSSWGTGKPSTGRRGTGEAASQRARVRDGQLPDPSGGRLAGELLEIERLTSSSGRGRQKSACAGNSLAAFSTARPVRGAVGLPGAQGAGRIPQYPFFWWTR